MSTVATFILQEIKNLNNLSRTSVKSTIIILTWYNYKPYYIGFTLSFYDQVFQPGNIFFAYSHLCY